MPDANRLPPGEMTVEQLIGQFHVPLYRYAFRLAGNAADAEDLVQQAFMIAFRKRDQVREPQHISAWLFAVLRSCFLKSRRKTQPQPAGSMDVNLDHFPERSPAPEEIDSQQLQLVLDELPAEYKIVVVMFYFEHCSYKEIAERLETPIGTVMSRLARAKQRLRARLSELDSPPVRLAESAAGASAAGTGNGASRSAKPPRASREPATDSGR